MFQNRFHYTNLEFYCHLPLRLSELGIYLVFSWTWICSCPVSQRTKHLIGTELKIKWYPTIIFLDPQRKIILVSGDGHSVLKGKKLLKELGHLLPTASEP